VSPGNSLAISCNPPYSNPSPPVIQFFKDGKALGDSSLVTDSGVLILQNVTSADSGSYWCSATNHITSETYQANSLTSVVIVGQKNKLARKSPQFLVKPKPYFVVGKEGNVSLECVAVGEPVPFVTWRKLRGSMMQNYKVTLGTLHLFNVDFAQEGEYVCEAYNGVGDSLTSLSTIVLNSK
jgi:hypothetical protein